MSQEAHTPPYTIQYSALINMQNDHNLKGRVLAGITDCKPSMAKTGHTLTDSGVFKHFEYTNHRSRAPLVSLSMCLRSTGAWRLLAHWWLATPSLCRRPSGLTSAVRFSISPL